MTGFHVTKRAGKFKLHNSNNMRIIDLWRRSLKELEKMLDRGAAIRDTPTKNVRKKGFV